MDPINVQKLIRDNATDVQDYVKDLGDWTVQMKAKELAAELANQVTGGAGNKGVFNGTGAVESENMTSKTGLGNPVSQTKKKAKISAFDYSAWDKFDVDKACEELDEEMPPEMQSEDERLKEQTRIELDKLAMNKKEEGNKHLKDKKYAAAIISYTEGLRLSPNNTLLFANRAQAFIHSSEFDKAIADCNEAIKSDPKYVKAYFRRAKANISLGRNCKAETDLFTALRLEPNNQEVKSLLSTIRMKSNVPKVGGALMNSQKGTSSVTHPRFPFTLPDFMRSDIKSMLDDDDKDDVMEDVGDIGVVYPRKILAVDKSEKQRSKRPLLPIHVKVVGQNIHRSDSNASITSTPPMSSSCSTPMTPMTPMDVSSPSFPTNSLPLMTTVPPKPSTAARFMTDWKHLRLNSEMSAEYLQQLSTEDYDIFQNSLEADVLSDILDLLVWEFLPKKWDVITHLNGLLNVPRISTITMFMSEKDRANVRRIISECPQKLQESYLSKFSL